MYLAPECPADYVLAKHEKDGRTCYGLSQSKFDNNICIAIIFYELFLQFSYCVCLSLRFSSIINVLSVDVSSNHLSDFF